ncbi:MAG: T9SS type A sorting domain-containing protein, partial [Flavobacteriaceae bacterium]|nr:T9SS type A sorting domain-containing protein [Flavobacteriaceae bacterium]
DSFYNSNIDNTTTQDYFNGISPGLESFNFSTLSIEPVENHLTEIKIYPNPTSSFIHIRSGKEIDQVKILDMTGKQVMEFMGSSRLDLRQLTAGTYFLQLQSHNTVVVKKIIIQ